MQRVRIASAFIRKTWLTLLAGVAALAGMSLDASAQKAASTDWHVECSNNGKALDCRAEMQVIQSESKQIIAGVTIRVPAETKKPVMMIQVPLGVLVAEPMTIRVDGGQPERVAIQTCTLSGCFGGASVSDGLLAAMRTGKQLKLAFGSSGKQVVTVEMPLAGFVPAYEKIK
jgi:invasion protein IalB